MSELKKEFDQRDGYHRQVVCREVQLPDGYWTPGRPGRNKDKKKTPGEKKWIEVPIHITRAVLRDIANNDWPRSRNYKSNDNISYGTGLPLRSVAKGVAVLKSVGILRRTQRGTKTYSQLDWDLMQKLREPFKVTPRTDPDIPNDLDDELEALKAEDVEDADDDDDGDDVSVIGLRATATTGGTTKDLVDLLMEFRPYQKHRLRPAVESVIKGLLKDKSADDIRAAWEGLEKWQRAMVVGKTNPGGYLRTILQNAIDQKPIETDEDDDAAGWSDNEELVSTLIGRVKADGEDCYLTLADLTDDTTIASFVRWAEKWREQHAPEVEYEVDVAKKQIRIFAGALTR
jgi:hypothetical protein